MSKVFEVLQRVAGLLPGLRWAVAATGMIFMAVAVVAVSPRASAQNDPVPCEQLDTSLNSEFANSICYRSRFRGDASGWHEHIQGENSRHLISVVTAKAINSRSYLRATNIRQIFERFSFPPEMSLLGDPEKTERGFEFATVGTPSSAYCFVFLREQRPGWGGYRQMQYGLICDKSRNSVYSVTDVETLLAKIDFAD